MDPSSFDRLSRVLARATTRRAAIGAVVAGLAGVVGRDEAVANPPTCVAGGATCKSDGQCCSGRCRLVGGGGVRRVCDCEPGTARCGGRCVRVDIVERCGSCDISCRTGEQCCNGKCRAVQTDENNCGACGVKCAAGKTCCKGVCVDLDTSKANCGACGKACAGSRICCDGTCKAGSTDENNCGACGNVCAAGETCCGGACVDLTSDEAHCGHCNKRCAAGATCCDGACANLQSNPQRCGACDNPCGALADTCEAGQCQCGTEAACDASTADQCDNGACQCGANPPCTDGLTCSGGDCLCGGTTCGTSEQCCSDTCVALDSDDHCGACDNACTAGSYCPSGTCTSCTVVAPGVTALADAITANPLSDAFCLQEGTYGYTEFYRPMTVRGKGDGTVFGSIYSFALRPFSPVRVERIKILNAGGFLIQPSAPGTVIDHVTFENGTAQSANAVNGSGNFTLSNATVNGYSLGVFAQYPATLTNVKITNCARGINVYKYNLSMDANSSVDGATTYAVYVEKNEASFTNNGGAITNSGGTCPNTVKMPDSSCCSTAAHLQTGTCAGPSALGFLESVETTDDGKVATSPEATQATATPEQTTPEATQAAATPEQTTPVATEAPTETAEPDPRVTHETPPPASPGA